MGLRNPNAACSMKTASKATSLGPSLAGGTGHTHGQLFCVGHCLFGLPSVPGLLLKSPYYMTVSLLWWSAVVGEIRGALMEAGLALLHPCHASLHSFSI